MIYFEPRLPQSLVYFRKGNSDTFLPAGQPHGRSRKCAKSLGMGSSKHNHVAASTSRFLPHGENRLSDLRARGKSYVGNGR